MLHEKHIFLIINQQTGEMWMYICWSLTLVVQYKAYWYKKKNMGLRQASSSFPSENNNRIVINKFNKKENI